MSGLSLDHHHIGGHIPLAVTAGQAAPKWQRYEQRDGAIVTAGQAAQKKPIEQRASLDQRHCRTGSSEMALLASFAAKGLLCV